MTQMPDVEQLLKQMEADLRSVLERRGVTEPVVIGIRTGGVWLAEQLNQRLGLSAPLGELDISFYRDDFSRIGLNPKVTPSSLPFDTEGRHIVLVDDVMMSGRTIRAARANASRVVERPVDWDDKVWLTFAPDSAVVLTQ